MALQKEVRFELEKRARPADIDSEAEEDEDDVIRLLDDSEALELVEFDPKVDPTDSWDPPHSMATFLDKHFNWSLSDAEKEAILKDFPKPKSSALTEEKG